MEPYSVAIRPEGQILVDFSARSAGFSTHIQWRQGDTAQPYFHIQWSAPPVILMASYERTRPVHKMRTSEYAGWIISGEITAQVRKGSICSSGIRHQKHAGGSLM